MTTKNILKSFFNPKGIKSTALKAIKPVKLFKTSKNFLKKKSFLKKKIKKFLNFLKKKKKLNITYKIFSLNNHSILYKLKRKIIKKFFKAKLHQDFLKLNIKLKRLFLLSTNIQKISALPELKKDLNSINGNSLKKVKFFLSITIHSNNIFMNLAKYLKKKTFKTVKFWSAGMFDFICSKKKLKFAISAMFKEVKNQLKQLKIYTIKINAPKYLNKYIFRQLRHLHYKTKLYIYSSFKIFNGCRSSKKRRKKRLRFRFFR